MAKGKKFKRQKPQQEQPRPAKAKIAVAHIQEAIPAKWKLIIAGMLAAVAMAVYAPSYSYDFVYDDDAVVKDNRYVSQGIGGLKEIWTTSYFQGFDENINARAYRPMPLTTFALQHEIWQLDPKGYHLFNILFYGLTAVILFLFLAKLLRYHHPALPVIVSLLFLLHPIHLEVVANIKSRDTMLAFSGFITASWFLLKHIDNRKILPLVFSLLFYFIGLFSKEEVITSLAVIPLMLYFFRNMEIKKIALYFLPYFAAVVIFLAIRSSILGGLNEGVTLTKLDNSLLGAEDFTQRSASTVFVLGHYLLKTVFPHPLISDYSWSTIPLVNWDDWRVYLSILANLGLLAVGIFGLLKRKIYGFGALQYFCAVSIFTSIITPNVSAYNDRFLYTPVLGVCLLISLLVLKLVKKQPDEAGINPASAFFKNNFVPVAIVVLLACAGIYKISSHLPYWKDRYVLFEHDAKLAPNNARMRKNNGGSYARLAVQHQETQPDLAKQYAGKAIEELKVALSIHDNIPTGYIHLGNMYIIRGEYAEAEEALQNALRQAPKNYFARTSLGNVYYRLGKYQEAAEILENIDKDLLSPNDYYLLSIVYGKLGNEPKASEYYLRSGR